MSEEDGGPAFPVPGNTEANEEGMNLRDFFAAMVLAGAIHNMPDRGIIGDEASASLFDTWAKHAYSLATAMLIAREEVQ